MLGLGTHVGELHPLGPAEHLHPIEAQQRREQRDRGGHGQRHRKGRGDRDTVEEGDAERVHAQQRDADGEPGEQDGPPGGVDGGDGRLLGRLACPQADTVPVDDEQCVVDTHAQADEGRQCRPELGDGHHVRHQADAGHADTECDDCRHQGQRHRQQGSERDEQDDRGGHDPEQFAGVLLRLFDNGDRAPVHLDLQRPAVGRAGGVDDRFEIGAGYVDRLVVQCDRGEGRPAVPGELAGTRRVVRAGHRDHVCQARDPLEHRDGLGFEQRVVEGPRAGVQHDAGGLSGGGGKLPFEQVDRLLGLGSGK